MKYENEIIDLTRAIAEADERAKELREERAKLFADARRAGVTVASLARVAGVTDRAVNKAIDTFARV